MTGHTYLSKSRDGVYYFRAVLPKGVRAQTGRREIRISLRTKDRAKAKVLVAREALRLTETLSRLEPEKTADHARPHPLQPDLVLVERHGEVDLDKMDAWDDLARGLNLMKFGTAYLHARIKRPLPLRKQLRP